MLPEEAGGSDAAMGGIAIERASRNKVTWRNYCGACCTSTNRLALSCFTLLTMSQSLQNPDFEASVAYWDSVEASVVSSPVSRSSISH